MEGKYLKFCPVCNKTGQNSMDWCFNEKSIEFLKGYHIFEPDGGFGKICPSCKKGVLEDSIITYEELEIIQDVSDSDRQFLEAMIELKKNDPIEYQLKMSQVNYPRAKARWASCFIVLVTLDSTSVNSDSSYRTKYYLCRTYIFSFLRLFTHQLKLMGLRV